MYEFGDGAWGGIGQADRDAVGQDDFGGVILGVNDIDRNEDCWIGR